MREGQWGGGGGGGRSSVYLRALIFLLGVFGQRCSFLADESAGRGKRGGGGGHYRNGCERVRMVLYLMRKGEEGGEECHVEVALHQGLLVHALLRTCSRGR